MRRRGSHPIGSSFALPILVLLAASALEFGKFFRTQEAIAAVAYAGARAGALARPADDAVAIARAAAEERWADAELSGSLQLDVSLESAAPVRSIAVRATVESAPVFGVIAVSPIPITCTRTVRIDHSYVGPVSTHVPPSQSAPYPP